ncbi:MAG: hypothetical protein RIB65_09475 [Ilumatobacter fluminis]
MQRCCGHVGLEQDAATGEPDDDETFGMELCVSVVVSFPCITVGDVILPSVALDHDRRTDEVKVDLEACEMGVESCWREAVIADESPHGDLEHTVGDVVCDRPSSDRRSEGDDTGATLPGVAGEQRRQRVEADAPFDGEVVERGGDRSGIDGTEVDERSEFIGRGDSLSVCRNQIEAIDRSVHHHALETALTSPVGDDVDRIIERPPEAQQGGRAAVRRHHDGRGGRPLAQCQHGGEDCLFPRRRRPRQTSDARMDADEFPASEGAVPRVAARAETLGLGPRDEAVVVRCEVVEPLDLHTEQEGGETTETETRCVLGDCCCDCRTGSHRDR